MKPEDHSIIGDDSVIEVLIDAIGETLLSRELTASERERLQAAALQSIGQIRNSTRERVSRTVSERTVFTPPELAKQWGVSPDKILGWIRSGELRATNIAVSQSGRPRYRIELEAIREFQLRRTNHSPTPVIRRKRRKPSDVIEFF